MSAMGLGRVKTVPKGIWPGRQETRSSQAAIAAISGLVPMIFMTPVRFVGQDGEWHLGGHPRKGFCEEVRRSHAGLHRAERMLDCLSMLTHGLRVASRRCCTAWSRCSCSHRRIRRSEESVFAVARLVTAIYKEFNEGGQLAVAVDSRCLKRSSRSFPRRAVVRHRRSCSMAK